MDFNFEDTKATFRSTGDTRCKKCGNPPSETEIEVIDNKDGTRGAQLWCPTREGFKEHPYVV